MAQRSTFATAVLVCALLSCPGFCEDAQDADPKPQPAKQPVVQLRAQPAAIAVRSVFGNPLNLVRNVAVQEELQLDDDQKSKVQEAVQAANAQRQELFGAVRGLQGDERQKKLAEVQKKVQQKTAEATKAIRAALQPQQAKRLDQISLQLRGLPALREAKVAEQLQLTDEQKKLLQDAAAAGQQKRSQLLQDVRNGAVERAKYREKLEEIVKQTEAKTMDVLTDKQKAQFEKMKGAKFTLPQRGFQFRAAPLQPGQPRRIQIQPQKIQGNGKNIQIRIQAAPKK